MTNALSAQNSYINNEILENEVSRLITEMTSGNQMRLNFSGSDTDRYSNCFSRKVTKAQIRIPTPSGKAIDYAPSICIRETLGQTMNNYFKLQGILLLNAANIHVKSPNYTETSRDAYPGTYESPPTGAQTRILGDNLNPCWRVRWFRVDTYDAAVEGLPTWVGIPVVNVAPMGPSEARHIPGHYLTGESLKNENPTKYFRALIKKLFAENCYISISVPKDQNATYISEIMGVDPKSMSIIEETRTIDNIRAITKEHNVDATIDLRVAIKFGTQTGRPYLSIFARCLKIQIPNQTKAKAARLREAMGEDEWNDMLSSSGISAPKSSDCLSVSKVADCSSVPRARAAPPVEDCVFPGESVHDFVGQ